MLFNTCKRTWSFVAGAGPVILELMMILWVTLTFPQNVQLPRDFAGETAQLEEKIAAVPEGDPAADSLALGGRAEWVRVKLSPADSRFAVSRIP